MFTANKTSRLRTSPRGKHDVGTGESSLGQTPCTSSMQGLPKIGPSSGGPAMNAVASTLSKTNTTPNNSRRQRRSPSSKCAASSHGETSKAIPLRSITVVNRIAFRRQLCALGDGVARPVSR